MMRLFSQKEPFATEDGLITPKNKNLYWAFGLVAGSWMIFLLVSGVIWYMNLVKQEKQSAVIAPQLMQFVSESEFRNYLGNQAIDQKTAMDLAPAELPTAMTVGESARYSETNTQVAGIDEPDIVKADGENLFISTDQPYYFDRVMPVPVMEPGIGIVPPVRPEIKSTTEVIKAFPPEETETLASIDANGKLLVTNDRLVVFENQKISGFDIKDPAKPTRAWEYELDGNRQTETARLIGEKIILVTKLPVYQQSPCPLPLWKVEDRQITVPCTDVWHPDLEISANITYTISRLNPKTGEVEASTTFLGSQGQTVVYVSNKAAYITFTKAESRLEISAKVILDENSTLIDAATRQKLIKVFDLDISQAAKQVEIEQILAGYTSGLSDDDRMKWEAEMTNAMNDYVDQNKRELVQTVITKIDVTNLEILASGRIPGGLLNQFSLDEYEGNLRAAVMVGGRNLAGTMSANDVYVLDQNLEVVGKVLDLGMEERIYAVRFMGDRGFVVTFKETDPLYVLNLANPAAPVVAGELKIPGYSSYLHPLKQRLMVGIGKEESQVKVALFDVSDSSKPTEIDKYVLPDYWSQILSTHLAFLQDEKHEVFFVPADNGGYVFSYQDNKLELKKTVSGGQINRAVYIDDYLYLVGNRKISVVDETSWQTIKTFEW